MPLLTSFVAVAFSLVPSPTALGAADSRLRRLHSAWNNEGGDFRANLERDPDVTAKLSAQQLEDCFSTDLHQANLGVIWQRLGL